MYYERRSGFGLCHRHGYSYEGRVARPAVPSGYRYVGSCRCGFGPHAYYETPEGRVVSPFEVYSGFYRGGSIKENLEAEKKYIEDEVKYLEERLKELEERLKEKEED
ncbi:MAG: hypothetical protein ACUVWP_08130 [bacterium]